MTILHSLPSSVAGCGLQRRAVAAHSLWTLALLLALAGCHQQTAPGDPFLPFMRSRVPPPGTNLPPGTADPYYSGAAPAGTPAAAPVAAPPGTTMPVDKYSPRGGFNVPQGSIDRTKAIDTMKADEVRAGPASFARRASTKPLEESGSNDTHVAAASPTAAIASFTAVAAAAQSTAAAPESTEPAATSVAIPTTSRWAASAPAAGPKPLPADALPVDALPASALDAPQATSAGSPPVRTASAIGTHVDDEALRPALAMAEQPANEPASGSMSLGTSAGSGRTTLRIRTAADDAFADSAEPVATNFTASSSRMRMTAGSASGAGATQVESRVATDSNEGRSALAGTLRPSLKVPDGQDSSGVVQASWVEPVAGDGQVAANSSTSSGPASGSGLYGYEPSYATLSGRLEYSESARQWKLRYIPIDGPTDQFGGSVLLANTSRIEGFKPGDFVSVRGAIASPAASSRGFSPTYQLSEIDAVR